MVLADGWPAQSGVADQIEIRRNLAGLLVRDSSGNPRPGVFMRHANALVASRADMKVDVAAFDAAAVRAGGPVFLSNDGTVTVSLDPAPVANSRYDVVYVRQKEDGYGGLADGSNGPEFGVQKGAASATPDKAIVLAAIPAGAIPLASLLIPSTATATNSPGVVITQEFPYTAAVGGVLPFRSTTEMDAFTPLTGGQRAWCIADSSFYVRAGASWRLWERAETAWTPTLQNFNALGTGGGATGAYSIAGGWCDFWIKINFGTGVATPSTSWGFSLPVPLRVALDDWNQKIGDGLLRDASVASNTAPGNLDLWVIFNADTGVAGFRQPYSGSAAVTDYGYLSAVQTGVPTLANGDYIVARGRFPV